MKKTTKKLLGYCAVDSGQLLIIDPCYLSEWRDGEAFPDERSTDAGNHYSEACKITTKEEGAGQINVSSVAGDGVVFSSGYGDGNYPVYGYYSEDNHIIKVVVEMG